MQKTDFGFWYYLSLVTQLGLVMASCVLVGLGLGMFLDLKFHSAPVGLFVCLFLGILAAFVSAYQLIMRKF